MACRAEVRGRAVSGWEVADGSLVGGSVDPALGMARQCAIDVMIDRLELMAEPVAQIYEADDH